METNIGGERLGSGNKETVQLRNYERSSHDLGYIWRSSMASGTLVPFMTEVGLPGDTFDIDLNCVVKTLPTVGPLFGSYKVQLDVFQVPIRLYNAKLHMNLLGIGLEMDKIKLPQIRLRATTPPYIEDIDNWQINSSCILSYLNIRGLGYLTGSNVDDSLTVSRDFNAVPYLAMFDIYKNYYANKQEEIGAIIHNPLLSNDINIDTVTLFHDNTSNGLAYNIVPTNTFVGQIDPKKDDRIEITYISADDFNENQWFISVKQGWEQGATNWRLTDIFSTAFNDTINNKIIFSNPKYKLLAGFGSYYYETEVKADDLSTPNIVTFPLSQIDDMRKKILSDINNVNAFNVSDYPELTAYNFINEQVGNETDLYNAVYSKQSAQEGLLLKTYQSDLFNNWISTEWLDGENGINSITSIDTSEGFFNIDTLNLSKKVYMLLNRIAVSGGTYDDYLNAAYTHERTKGIENPMYCGGLSKELIFEEIFSQTGTAEQPLGTLAGRGQMTNKHKGGHVKVKIDEPSYIMGIVSITPRIDYSQGNKWDVNLKTLNDLHKPALDEIGFQDLITDQMAWYDTELMSMGSYGYQTKFKSAGKQPAWINYMTNVNQVRGSFAESNNEMFMTLNRRYEPTKYGEEIHNDTTTPLLKIKDLTTYVDPTKFNYIFADTKITAMNFWTQIKVDILARRKMSAKVMPNL